VQTYARRLDVVPYFGTHAVTDDAGLKAQAVEIDQELKAFAVTSASLPVPVSDELARRKVLAWNTFQQPASCYEKLPPKKSTGGSGGDSSSTVSLPGRPGSRRRSFGPSVTATTEDQAYRGRGAGARYMVREL
jgi:hypothetical protein